MKLLKSALMATFFILVALVPSPSHTQTKTNKTEGKASTPPHNDAETNVQAYIDLLHSDVRQQKAEFMGSVMLLSAQDAAKFWPIYSDYDAQLAKLNEQRIGIIKEYAQSYNQMTDAKADDLIQKSLAYQKQRSELLVQTYDKVKEALGAVTAARFAMVEHQLLLLIDLQIDSSLPVVGQGA